MTKYFQGKFTPNHPNKYKGNVKNIIYRSSWEFEFLKKLDSNASVLSYSSEEVPIRYYNPIKLRWSRYYPDFLIEAQETDGSISKLMVEIKPLNQIQVPRQTKGKKMQTYMNEVMEFNINRAKWAAAIDWCRERDIKFVVLTKDEKNNFQSLNEEQLKITNDKKTKKAK